MGTRVGREVHGEEEEKGGRARREGSWRVMKKFRVLRAARDAFFFAPIASQTTARSALGSYKRYGAYGVNNSPISRRKFFVAFLRVSQRAFWPKRFLC